MTTATKATRKSTLKSRQRNPFAHHEGYIRPDFEGSPIRNMIAKLYISDETKGQLESAWQEYNDLLIQHWYDVPVSAEKMQSARENLVKIQAEANAEIKARLDKCSTLTVSDYADFAQQGGFCRLRIA